MNMQQYLYNPENENRAFNKSNWLNYEENELPHNWEEL